MEKKGRSKGPGFAGRGLYAVIAAGIATAVAYAGWLAWDHTYYVGDDGNRHGPYEAWQVIGLALTLGLVAAIAGWRQRPWTGSVTITVVLTALWSMNAMTVTGGGANLWPIGAAMLAAGTFAGTIAVGVIAEAISSRKAKDDRAVRPLTSR